MNITLENESLLVKVKGTGAELSSVKSKQDLTEYIWQADPQYWKRHAPVLFPIVGRLKNNQYYYKDKTYNLNQHGFARDLPFELISQSATTATLSLHANPHTRDKYPFEFRLIISYQLNQHRLQVSYQVENIDTKVLPFSIGAHPGFSCPISGQDRLEDYMIEFEQPEESDTHLLQDGLFDYRTQPYLQQQQSFPITPHTFDHDALVFHDLKSRYVRLLSQQSGRYVQVSIERFPYLGIWAKPGAPFVCIEPWHGLADYVDSQGDLFAKKGMLTLSPGKHFNSSYEITFQ